MIDSERYFLKRGTSGTWEEVTRAEWIRAERDAGFHRKVRRFQPGTAAVDPCDRDVPATAGFSTTRGGGIAERITDMRDYSPAHYAFDPSFPVLTAERGS